MAPSSSDFSMQTMLFQVKGDEEIGLKVRVRVQKIKDNPLLFDMNVKKRVNDFIDVALTQPNVTRTNHIMWTMVDDFRYQYAESWVKQMDKLFIMLTRMVMPNLQQMPNLLQTFIFIIIATTDSYSYETIGTSRICIMGLPKFTRPKGGHKVLSCNLYVANRGPAVGLALNRIASALNSRSTVKRNISC